MTEAAWPAKPLDVLVIGAGFSGLAMAIRCLQSGIDDLLVVEKAEEVGGTWRENTYPGAACDIPAHLYALSFAPKDDWSRTYAGQPEIAAYLREVTDRFGLAKHLALGTAVTGAVWDEARSLWRVETDRGPLEARVLVSGMGALHHPAVPAIPGLHTFAGALFHTAAWDHGVPLAGKRVGVIGTGASAIQVVPAIAPEVGHLTLFQRTPPWVVPRNDRPIGPRMQALFRRLPAARRLLRGVQFWLREAQAALGFTRVSGLTRLAEAASRRHLRKQVPDLDLRARLAPPYRLGCKRVLISDDYYPALTRPNVTLETGAIRAVTPDGVTMADGTHHSLDVLVLATGFDVTASLARVPVVGRDGLILARAWGERVAAHRGVALAGFPNFFMLLGPNTGLGHNSVVLMIEAQVGFVLACLAEMRTRNLAAIEPAPEAQARYLAELEARLSGSIWQQGGCASWYQDAAGRNIALWPGTVVAYQRAMRAPNWGEFVLTPAGTR
ncbi:4-hydroxyacetophenone monooxygenase [Methylobacterium variabile]|uniref:4-hydroxyacetophenone monooxygenase n=1 Tax=Methylobacterium variabile TaxID=298794 RepID=A0A0J6UN14_9HYPH|nr:NAD(P)/FAD-dependent oxidoreductase [Methylobacterium variabile]KMO27421.1 4-hydroxyacetophenone monooxygenase [Methylobacterium variabile]